MLPISEEFGAPKIFDSEDADTVWRAGMAGAASPHEGALGTGCSEQSELAQAATSPNARNRSDSI